MIDGGDSGERAVVPGEPDRSLLVKAINHVGDYHMPPKRKLDDEQIAALTEWVKTGAALAGASTRTTEQKLSPLRAGERASADRTGPISRSRGRRCRR